jgi:predicted HTH transcriptional regulator
MRVFRDLELVEHLGSGIPRILKAYDASVFEIRESYLRVIFPYREGFTTTDGSDKSSDKSSDKILEMMKENPKISAKAMAEILQLTPRAVEKQIADLKTQGFVKRVGERKGGHWEIMNHGE